MPQRNVVCLLRNIHLPGEFLKCGVSICHLAAIFGMDGPMEREQPKDERGFIGGGLVVSLLLHVFVAVVLIEGVSLNFPEPEVKAIEVAILQEPVEEELQKAEESLPEEKPVVEPPEPEPEPEASTPSEPEVAQEEPAPQEPAAQPLAIHTPVTEFAEEDTGPTTEEEQQEAELPTEGDADASEVAEVQPAEETPTDEPATEPESEETAEAVDQTGLPDENLPEDGEVTSDETIEDPAETELTEAEEVGTGVVGPIVTNALPPKKPAARRGVPSTAQAGPPRPLQQARQLYSGDLRDDPRTRLAMNRMTKGERLVLLCRSELQAQLAAANPPRPPDILPSPKPREATTLEIARVAFRSRGLWYDVAFKCSTNALVTRVTSFSLKVGDPVPRSEWGARGFPSF